MATAPSWCGSVGSLLATKQSSAPGAEALHRDQGSWLPPLLSLQPWERCFPCLFLHLATVPCLPAGLLSRAQRAGVSLGNPHPCSRE